MSGWNGFKQIKKTRKSHKCACTGKEILVGSSCWHYIGEWQGEFQSWYCSDEAKQFIDNNNALVYDWDEFQCQDVGELMREVGVLEEFTCQCKPNKCISKEEG